MSGSLGFTKFGQRFAKMEQTNSYFLITILLISIFVNPVKGQEVLAKIPFKNSTGENLRSYNFGDSLLLSIMESSVSRKTYNYWVTKKGVISKADITTVNRSDKFVTDIIKYGNDYFTYNFSNKRVNPILLIQKNNDLDNIYQLQLSGKLLASFGNSTLFILTYEKENKLLRVIEVEKDNIKNESIIDFPFDLTEYNPNDIRYIAFDSHILLPDAAARLKITMDGNNLILLADEPYQSWHDANVLAKTLICEIDLQSNTLNTRFILEASHNDFRSFLHDGLLYRLITNSKKFELKVFDTTGKRVSGFVILRDPDTKKQKVFFRARIDNQLSIISGKETQLANVETLYHTMLVANQSRPLIIVEKTSDKKVVLTCGNYYNRKGASAGIGIPDPIRLPVAIFGTTVKQFTEGPGVSRYFYMSQDKVGNYQIDNELKTPRGIIDSYEVSKEKDSLKFSFKGYTSFGLDFLGLYQYRKSDSIEIINYGNLYK